MVFRRMFSPWLFWPPTTRLYSPWLKIMLRPTSNNKERCAATGPAKSKCMGDVAKIPSVDVLMCRNLGTLISRAKVSHIKKKLRNTDHLFSLLSNHASLIGDV